MFQEKEILSPVNLCDANGHLNPNAVGWARRPYIISNLKGHFMRKKKWHYWCVYGDDIMFSATISHLDYAVVCFVYYLEYKTKRFFEKTLIIPLSQLKFPEKVQETIEVSKKGMHLSFISSEKETLIKVACSNFDHEDLAADLKITYPDKHDTLNVVVPWPNDKFQFTAKHHCLPTEGRVEIGDRTYTFDANQNFAILDYGRGVWPRKSQWNWGMASGLQGKDIIGLNLGGKWTDLTGSTENAFFLNGEIDKISEDLQFKYDQKNYMTPWQVQGQRLQLSFTPFYERRAQTNVGLIASDVHQLFGHYDGFVLRHDGSKYEINHLLGAIEEHMAKW